MIEIVLYYRKEHPIRFYTDSDQGYIGTASRVNLGTVALNGVIDMHLTKHRTSELRQNLSTSETIKKTTTLRPIIVVNMYGRIVVHPFILL